MPYIDRLPPPASKLLESMDQQHQQPRAIFICQETALAPEGGRPELPPKRGAVCSGADHFKTLPPPKSFRSGLHYPAATSGTAASGSITTKTLPRKMASTFQNGPITHLNNPLYVSQNSVAVMTSPTFSSQMGRTSFTTNSSLSDSESTVSASQVLIQA